MWRSSRFRRTAATRTRGIPGGVIPAPRRTPPWLRRLLLALGAVVLLGAATTAVAAVWIVSLLPHPLPSLDLLESFVPRDGSQIYDADDEFLTELHAERQIFVPLDRVSHWVTDALIATEDRRFYTHWGLDPLGMARALSRNVRSGHVVEGGSTLTQQLAKMLFLTPDRSLRRKVTEAVLARSGMTSSTEPAHGIPVRCPHATS